MTEMLLRDLVIRAINLGRRAYLWLLFARMSRLPALFFCFPPAPFLSFPPGFPRSKKIPEYSLGLAQRAGC
jgi:hypothetical protein